MMLLFFSLGDDTYAVKCERVREISPMVELKKVLHGPDYFAGFFHYRGMVIPVVDLCRVVLGQPCRMRMSSRIIVAEVALEENAASFMGFMAEGVTQAGRRSRDLLLTTGTPLQSHPYLSGVLMEDKQMIHLLDPDALAKSLPVLPSL